MRRASRVLALLVVAMLAASGIALSRPPARATAGVLDATIELLTATGSGTGTIVTVHSNAPSTPVASRTLSGFGSETPVAMDIRPADRTPYVVTRASDGRLTLWRVDLASGVLTGVPSVFFPGQATVPFDLGPHTSDGVGLDFDPVGDLARVVDRGGDNGYVDMSDGSFHGSSTLASTGLRGIGYDRAYAGASASTLLAIADNGGSPAHLLRVGGVDGSISPNGGATTDLGSLGAASTASEDLDIAPDGTAFALLGVGGGPHLYSLDLGSAAGTDRGATPAGAVALAVVPPASTISIAPGTGAFTVPSNESLAVFTIVRTGGVGTVTIGYHTLDGSALAGRDYVPMLGSIFFTGADAEPKTIAVPISGGRNGQGRSFSLVLSDPSGGASLGASTSTVTFGPPKEGGYWLAASDGGVFTFGGAPLLGSTANIKLNQPVVGIASTPNENGYWLVASDGGIFSFGDARWFGSTGNLALARPIVGMARTPDGGGYWLVASDGGVFTFGDAGFHGSTGGLALTKPIVAMAATPSGHGYWLVASDGGVFTFGDAGFHGSTGGLALTKPIVGMAPTRSGHGYWLVASDGGVFTFGDAPFLGTAGALPLVRPIVAMAATPNGDGYWLTASDGGIFTFGRAIFSGSTGGIKLNRPVVGITAR
ncbi:MAG: hypothetical protein JWL73_1374 [Actinomycetia bacterium]|nr:hypothetical protein [Actinomycetes bacterium]